MASFTDLNDEDFFPPWEHLPGHVYLDGPSPFYHSEDNGGDSRSGTGHRYTPKRHWCFLGEIKSYERFMRCRTVVKDDFDRKYIIAFYLDDSNAFDSSKLREGHTMAVMYAHQHAFADGTCGVRVENPDYVRVSVHLLLVALLRPAGSFMVGVSD